VEYADFCRLVQIGAVVTIAIFGVTGPILTKLTNNIATILPLNTFESELPYFLATSEHQPANESHFVNFILNWLPLQRPFINWKTGPDLSSQKKYL